MMYAMNCKQHKHQASLLSVAPVQPALESPGNLLKMYKLEPAPDLLNQGLILNKVPRRCVGVLCLRSYSNKYIVPIDHTPVPFHKEIDGVLTSVIKGM